VSAVSYGCELMYLLREPKAEVEVVVVVEAEVGFGPIFAVSMCRAMWSLL
jgi:hypothetical protein